MFKKILIANRGEIAVRIIRACREMGVGAVAVYSEADRAALHVQKADKAYCIGPAAVTESYLSIAALLQAADRCGADAVHPGYGFLSENAQFARACADAGLKFIGPRAEAMEMMGSKTSGRRTMQAAGVPLVPGSIHALSRDEAIRVAREVGYPIMLKAVAGGGGKGMRLVRDPKELESAFEAASSEALRAFGSAEVYIEKLIVEPRHIEIQILADEHGHCVYLGERECSLQRRHQKVVEEAPSAVVEPELRRRMGEAAVRVAQAAGYTNAGTVEFLVDSKQNFYFLEMNTRLQVEHPVTEMVTGLDLVQLQINIAAGKPLPFKQENIHPRGHAIECRLYAEDPENNFFPSPGKITRLITPSGPGVREDSGVYEGWQVPLEYDPLLSKLIVWARTRKQAIARMERALDEYFIGGIKTNLALFRRILRDPGFRKAEIHTAYLDQMLAQAPPAPEEKEGIKRQKVAAIAAALLTATSKNGASSNGAASANGQNASAWKTVARRESMR
ncbi:MAG TPA: acetyl-CoA carboxylase biotin carboxylase subunit [Terriglobales bacterium]|nr:acetyl-CoA carboxylase biotin carboxylase subunit [Terriglobales bacterium]